jgi:hypothetical protein
MFNLTFINTTTSTDHNAAMALAMSEVVSQETFKAFLTNFYTDSSFYLAEYDSAEFLDWQEEQSVIYFPDFDVWETLCMDLGIA